MLRTCNEFPFKRNVMILHTFRHPYKLWFIGKHCQCRVLIHFFHFVFSSLRMCLLLKLVLWILFWDDKKRNGMWMGTVCSLHGKEIRNNFSILLFHFILYFHSFKTKSPSNVVWDLYSSGMSKPYTLWCSTLDKPFKIHWNDSAHNFTFKEHFYSIHFSVIRIAVILSPLSHRSNIQLCKCLQCAHFYVVPSNCFQCFDILCVNYYHYSSERKENWKLQHIQQMLTVAGWTTAHNRPW